MPEQVHRLFFALRPDAFVADQISQVAATVKDEAILRGRWVKPHRYHLTVQFLGTHAERPVRSIDQACVAAVQVRLEALDLVLNRIETFGGHRRAPCILRCTEESDTAVQALRTVLGESLAAERLAHLLEDRFTPHVTIGYVERQLPEPIAISPIPWRVCEFTLVESRGGANTHAVLGRWSLSA